MDNKNEFKIILERVSDAFVALDLNWNYTYINAKAGEILGRNPKELIGKNIWTEFPEGIEQPFYKAYHRAMKSQKYEYLEEYYVPYDLWFENHIYPSLNGLTIYFRDISTRKKNEALLTSYQEKLEQKVKHRTMELEHQNAIVRNQKEQIENAIKELHHRVKNNMQIIVSLLRLQSKKVNNKIAKEVFVDCQKQIISMSLVHEKMYQSESLTVINSKSYFPSLINGIIESVNINKNISLDLNVDSMELPSKIIIPLGLLVNEIVLNAIKHGFNDRKDGEIIFYFTNDSDNKFKVLVGDNGIGFNGNSEENNGIGMDLIKSFLNTLNATMTRTVGNGTLYEINFESVNL